MDDVVCTRKSLITIMHLVICFFNINIRVNKNGIEYTNFIRIRKSI